MKRIKIKIEDGQADKLYKIAEDKKENVSLLIRQAIDDYIKKILIFYHKYGDTCKIGFNPFYFFIWLTNKAHKQFYSKFKFKLI